MTFPSAFGPDNFLDFSHSNMFVVVSHCCLRFQFSNVIWCRTSFHMHICHVCIFFGGVSVQTFSPFFNWVIFLLLSFKCSLYIFLTSSLSDKCLGNIFSSLWLVFSYSNSAFCRIEVFNFNQVQLINFFFYGLHIWCCIEKNITNPRPSMFSPMVYYRSFIALCFMFMSMIHFQLILGKSTVSVSRFLFRMDVQLFQHCLSKRLFLLH